MPLTRSLHVAGLPNRSVVAVRYGLSIYLNVFDANAPVFWPGTASADADRRRANPRVGQIAELLHHAALTRWSTSRRVRQSPPFTALCC